MVLLWWWWCGTSSSWLLGRGGGGGGAPAAWGGGTSNNNAPRLIVSKKKVTPARVVKNLYIQESHIRAFDKLVFSQKMLKGKNAPELAEEAIELLLKQYNAEF